MSHVRKPLLIATVMNTGIVIVEAGAGSTANSLSLMMDGVHNLSDELALICLFLAYTVRLGHSRGLQQSANFLNSVGLIVLSIVVVWQAIERMLHPSPITPLIPIVIGILAAVANWGVAMQLRSVSSINPAIRLAYVHNLGDVAVSLGPVIAGVLTALTGSTSLDPLIAAGIAGWIAWTTARELAHQSEAIMWPEQAICGHDTGSLVISESQRP